MSEAPQTFLDSGTSFEGKVSFRGVVRIDGHLKGEASADGTLVIGETGVVEGQLDVGSLIVQGVALGEITARVRVEIHSTARVEGQLATPFLRVHEGAHVTAKVRMGKAGERPTPPSQGPAPAPR